jgi:hypothetical protein
MFEPWREMAKKFGEKYGVMVMVGGDKAYSTDNEIYLPGDVPEKLLDAMTALFLHEKEHIIQSDVPYNRSQDKTFSHFLNVVEDIHNDNLVLNSEPSGEALYKKMMEYIEAKNPNRDQLHWKQKAVLELIQRSWPHEVYKGWGFTKDPMVKHFFKRNRKEIGLLMKEIKEFVQNRPAQNKWAKWLLEKLFQDTADEQGIPMDQGAGQQGAGDPGKPGSQTADQGGGPLAGIPKELLKAILKQIEQMGGLMPSTFNGFECITPGDLKQKVPDAVTISQLKEFFTEHMEKSVTREEGGIDPEKLPIYWQTEEIFKDEEITNKKRVKVHLLLDTSGSMNNTLSDGTKKYEALVRAVGLVCQAADKIIMDEGLDIEVDAWAFGERDRVIKTGGEKWNAGQFKTRYWKGGDGITRAASLVKMTAELPDENGVNEIVLLITDGEFNDNADEEIKQAQAGKKKWILIGVGRDVDANGHFRMVAKSTEEIEYILVRAVKEATVA